MKKLIAAALMIMAAQAAPAAEFSSNRSDFTPFLNQNWMFFFKEGQREYFQVITCTDTFTPRIDGGVRAVCYSGAGEDWSAVYSAGDDGFLILYRGDSAGRIDNDSYAYTITAVLDGIYRAGYSRVVNGDLTVPKPAYLRRVSIDRGLMPAPDLASVLAAHTTISGGDPTFSEGRIRFPVVNVVTPSGETKYSVEMQHVPEAEGLQLRVTNATPK